MHGWKGSTERFTATSEEKLVDMRDHLQAVAEDDRYTLFTRQLAEHEVEYMNLILMWRRGLTRQQRLRLSKNGIAPWFGNWEPRLGDQTNADRDFQDSSG